MSETATRALLEGVRVLDLSQYIPGPFATRQLADLGAEVIKIEPPDGDPMRRIMYQGSEEVSPIYRHLNRGKRICRLDLKSELGKATLIELIRDANVLLESFRPGVLERLGFGQQELKQLNPSLVHCALSGYGQTGPYRNRAGHDINYLAASSALSVSGLPEKPIMSFPPIADHAGAMQASTAILAALFAQQKHGTGAYLDISLFESALSWQYLSYLEPQSRGEGLLSGGMACYNIYQCADHKFISLGALEAHFWKNFCNAVGQKDWITRQSETMPQRRLIEECRQLFASQSRSYWDELLRNVDCCYEALVEPNALSRLDHIQARGSMTQHGPNYPGWINQQSVELDSDFSEITDPELLHW